MRRSGVRFPSGLHGTRIWVGLVLDLLAHGMTVGQILDECPSLTDAGIRACLASGAKLSTGRYLDVA
jgi:uncharacterized protein (DUF433 family)